MIVTEPQLACDVTSALFPRNVVTVETNLETVRGVVLPEEASLVRNCTPRRQREFFAGRACAREAMRRLAVPDTPVLKDARGAPLWPSGIVGSLSHTSRYGAAAVARVENVDALGLDIERIADVDESCWPYIYTERELAWLLSQAAHMRRRLAALLFSAKECFYKCQYALTQQWLEYRDVAIVVDLARNTFQPQPSVEVAVPSETVFLGRYRFHHEHAFTGMTAVQGRRLDLGR